MDKRDNLHLRWTRDGLLKFQHNEFETFERLVLSPTIRDKITRIVDLFLRSKEPSELLHLPWHSGLFLYGPAGTGKTAAGKAIAAALEWDHFTIPDHEITDAHFLEWALQSALSSSGRVIVLENVDTMLKHMEPEVFFDLLDHALDKANGTFWIASSRHPEDTPKTQLLRPGRFDEAVRLEAPHTDLRKELLQKMAQSVGMELSADLLSEWLERTEGLTYSHFEEMRRLLTRMIIEGAPANSDWSLLSNYIEDQIIAGNRWGFVSDQTEKLQEKLSHVDPKILTAALDMTSIFQTLIEKSIVSAAEDKANSLEDSE